MANLNVCFLLILTCFSRGSDSFYYNFISNLTDYYDLPLDGFRYGNYKYNEEYPYYKGFINTTEEYDFIIVGGGSAGTVLANRLSEIADWNILLLEAGKPEIFITDIPLLAAWLQFTDYAWPYKMAKQDNICLAMNNQQCRWPRGKALGGSSVINYMMYTRGSQYDYDKWAAQGNPGWSWDEVLPYFIRSEDANLKFADEGKHGKGGFLSVEEVNYITLAETFLSAAKELGYEVLDYNGNKQFGFSLVQATTRHGRRCSGAKAFIKPVEARSNLRILPLSRVTKILINPETKTAYGVEYLRNRKQYTALATKEVILSAGTMASPQILMLSGVGPKSHLEEMNITVIQDLPVGQFLQDHVTFVMATFLINESLNFDFEDALQIKHLSNYFLNGKGPLTSLGGVEALGYIKTNVSEDPVDEYPDVELIFLGACITADRGGAFKDSINMREDFYQAVFKDIEGRPCWSVVPTLLQPKSTGTLRLKSTNIFDHPIMMGNYYSDPENKDIQTMIAAIREVIRLSETDAFQKYGSELHKTPYVGCEKLEFNSDEYWECALRQVSPTLHHQIGTCRMGPNTDPLAVVDNRLKVHGINKLRVIDTSVIPFSLTAHTNAPAYMIAEKAADFIKSDWISNFVPESTK